MRPAAPAGVSRAVDPRARIYGTGDDAGYAGAAAGAMRLKGVAVIEVAAGDTTACPTPRQQKFSGEEVWACGKVGWTLRSVWLWAGRGGTGFRAYGPAVPFGHPKISVGGVAGCVRERRRGQLKDPAGSGGVAARALEKAQ